MNRRRLDAVSEYHMREAMRRSLPICVTDTARTFTAVRTRVSQHKRVLGGLDVVIVDYLQLMDLEVADREKRYEALGRLSASFKRLAQTHQVIVVALAQLNRQTDDRKGIPRLSDLRESGNLEQDADQVWLLYRPEMSGKAAQYLGGQKGVELIVAKNRHGPTGKIELDWRAEAMTFIELAGEQD
jgi:replicative DNA helicase